MSEWKGLDPGGTEQLWDSSVLIGALQIFKAHEPFSRGDAQSPIYDDLEEKFPEITWRNFDQSGSFRPVFRKTNPWVKLNLVSDETNNAYLTPVGDELLSGEKSLNEVFVEATKNFVEIEGDASYQTICRFMLQLPNITITLEDVEFAISDCYVRGELSATDSINKARNLGLTFPLGSRRPRTLRAMMNALVITGAIVNSVNGWILRDPSIAKEIANIEFLTTNVATDTIPSENPVPATTPTTSPRSVNTVYSGREIRERNRAESGLTSRALSKTYDPINRALLLEKANSIHEQLVQKCAGIIKAQGHTALEDPNSFDVACLKLKVLMEVKSINSINAVSQLRKAVAQLPEYRWRHKDHFDQDSRLLVITNANPSNYVDNDYIDFLLTDRRLFIFWDDGANLVNHLGTTLQDFLIQPH
jgi:hypothetical protein